MSLSKPMSNKKIRTQILDSRKSSWDQIDSRFDNKFYDSPREHKDLHMVFRLWSGSYFELKLMEINEQ